MSGSRSRTGVHLVSYSRSRDTSPANLAEAFALMVERQREDRAWQDRGRCAETDPEAFFPEKGGSSREAKRICMSCEVRVQCLEYALEHDEKFGIWGGLSERARRAIRRSREGRAA